MSDQYLLPCSCGQSVRVGRAQAGQAMACACGKELTVPTLRGLRDLEPAPPDAAAAGAASWNPTRGAIFSGGLVIALLALVYAGFQFWGYARVSTLTTDHTDRVVAMEEEVIDQMSPADMLDMWHEINEHGIGPKLIPIWVAAKEQAGAYSWRGIVATVIGVAGLIAALGAAFLGRQRRAGARSG